MNCLPANATAAAAAVAAVTASVKEALSVAVAVICGSAATTVAAAGDAKT
jgi:hypothetical protein